MRPGFATHFWRTPAGHTVWTVRTRTGRQVTTSARHPFLTPEGWMRADELKRGDRIAVARHIRIPGASQPLPRVAALGHAEVDVDRLPIRPGRKLGVEVQRAIIRAYLDGRSIIDVGRTHGMAWTSALSVIRRYGIRPRWRRVWATAPAQTSPDFWRWFGYFTAEGYAYEARGSYRVSIANTDPEVRADYMALSRSLFGVTCRTRGKEMYFDALNLQPFFESLGFTVPTNSATKAIPDLLFACPDEEIAAFLQGYLDGDGTVDKSGVSAVTKSPRLASQIQMLLSRLGVISFVRTIRSRATNGRMTEPAEYASIAVYGDDVVALARSIRFRSRHKHRNLEYLIARRSRGRRPTNWDTIPVPPPLFRMLRRGLGLTGEMSGRPSAVNNIENGDTEPVRSIVRYFLDLFERLDRDRRFREEIDYMRFLCSDDIAWDRVEEVREEPADVPFLY
ncbi:MAG TPA: LAGLIDADG family homing endonuclease, partial [Candidatus Eisenbacteria bacterium]|nr:LAGLIDADG family homing endonuclease [Candidatus Eisenbacteria bacterium]